MPLRAHVRSNNKIGLLACIAGLANLSNSGKRGNQSGRRGDFCHLTDAPAEIPTSIQLLKLYSPLKDGKVG